MSKTKKIVLIAVASLAVVLVLGAFIVLSRIDGIVRSTVEREGTNQLSLATTLADADVSLFGGSLTLDKLAVANPEGYAAPEILELGQLNVGVGYGDLLGEPVRVRQINVTSPRLTIERSGEGIRGLTNLNVRDLLKNLETEEETETTKLIIDQLTVSRAQVVIRPNIQGLEDEYTLTLPDVMLNEIGTADEAKNGAEIGRVLGQVTMALARQAAASEDLPPELRAALSGDLRSVVDEYAAKLGDRAKAELQDQLGKLGLEGTPAGDAAGRLLEGDTKGAADAVRGAATREAGKAVDDVKGRAADEVRKGLGGLLGGDKKKSD